MEALERTSEVVIRRVTIKLAEPMTKGRDEHPVTKEQEEYVSVKVEKWSEKRSNRWLRIWKSQKDLYEKALAFEKDDVIRIGYNTGSRFKEVMVVEKVTT